MNSALLRTLVIYGVVLPLAVIVGWMLSTPLHLESLSVVGGVLFIILLPVILSHHYAILIFSWSALLSAFFLPGQPYFWTLMVVINIGMMVFYRILQRRPMFIHVPSLTFSVIALGLVVLVTAKLRGGIGMRVLGSSSMGGKQYFFILMALLGYFAFASGRIPFDRLKRYTGYYLLSPMTGVVSHVLYYFPSTYFLFVVFPVGFAAGQYMADQTGAMQRLGGLAGAGSAVVFYMLAWYGLRGIFNLRSPLKIMWFTAFFVLSLTGGYRGVFVLNLGLCIAMFCLEGLWRTRWVFVLLFVGILGIAIVVPVARTLPRPMQRVLSILPVPIDPEVRADAEGSTEWRTRMWAAVLPDAPRYFWLGKGYSVNATDMFLVQQSIQRGYAPSYTAALAVGDYHNGPLSVYMPFGVPGCVAFLAFMFAVLRALYLNYRYGPEPARRFNRFLFGFMICKFIFFLAVFGSFHSDMATFTGLAGLSVAVNRGVCRRPLYAPRRAVAGDLIAAPGAA